MMAMAMIPGGVALDHGPPRRGLGQRRHEQGQYRAAQREALFLQYHRPAAWRDVVK